MKHKPRMDRSDLSWKCAFYNPFHKYTYLQEAEFGEMSFDSLYMVNGWVMCRAQRACHNIFYAVFYTAHDRTTHKNQNELARALHHIPGPHCSQKQGVKNNTRYRWTQTLLTHTHALFPLYLFRTCPALCLCNALVVLAHAHTGSCLLMAWCKTRPSYILFSWGFFCSQSLSFTGCFVLFSFGCLNVCFAACIECSVQHITYKYIYTHTHTHTHASLSLGRTHII